jgi:hypothetical protein
LSLRNVFADIAARGLAVGRIAVVVISLIRFQKKDLH